jgi:hypothetical protein
MQLNASIFHVTWSFHVIIFLPMHMHHTGSNEVNPVAVPEEQEEQLEGPEHEVPEAVEGDVKELKECPDHRPSSFERGKP